MCCVASREMRGLAGEMPEIKRRIDEASSSSVRHAWFGQSLPAELAKTRWSSDHCHGHTIADTIVSFYGNFVLPRCRIGWHGED
jgi:hypothetical protein